MPDTIYENRRTIIAFFILFFSLSVKAANTFTTIPFQNIIVNPNDTITATYDFGPNAVLFCYSDQFQNTGSTGNIIWPFQGAAQSSTIPITLSINPIFEGQPIDPVGTIIVQNTLPTASVMNCVFAF